MHSGIFVVFKIYANADNPEVEGYGPSKICNCILYLHANNLYSWAMSQPFPTNEFKWVKENVGYAEIIASHPVPGPECCFFEVELEYTKELQDMHNTYLLAPECIVVQKEWMPEDRHKLLGVEVTPTEVEKLIPNLRDDSQHLPHYEIYSSACL